MKSLPNRPVLTNAARRSHMVTRRIAMCLALSSVLGGPQALAAPKYSRAMRLLDTDSDGTVDLEEAKKAAAKLFDKLDGDRDGTLESSELRGRLSRAELSASDPDKDKTLSKDE